MIILDYIYDTITHIVILKKSKVTRFVSPFHLGSIKYALYSFISRGVCRYFCFYSSGTRIIRIPWCRRGGSSRRRAATRQCASEFCIPWENFTGDVRCDAFWRSESICPGWRKINRADVNGIRTTWSRRESWGPAGLRSSNPAINMSQWKLITKLCRSDDNSLKKKNKIKKNPRSSSNLEKRSSQNLMFDCAHKIWFYLKNFKLH